MTFKKLIIKGIILFFIITGFLQVGAQIANALPTGWLPVIFTGYVIAVIYTITQFVKDVL